MQPGSLAIDAVAQKENPAGGPFFESYTDEVDFRSHIESSHFKRLRATTQDSVVSRKLVETVPI